MCNISRILVITKAIDNKRDYLRYHNCSVETTSNTMGGTISGFKFLAAVVTFFTILGLSLGDDFEDALGHITPKASPEVQVNAVQNLIKRLIPNRANEFLIEINPKLGPIGKDSFRMESLPNKTIKIVATTGVTAATAFTIYLKYYCNAHVSWEFSRLELPSSLPNVNLIKTLNDRFRYYQNVCTTSYSFVWWDWKQWEKHIDWMALNSLNLVLAFNGQEAIWQRVYSKLNLTQEEINEQFTGPAFLSWERMGNLRGWAGPLSSAWHQRSLKLQKLILKRMRELGIIPVLPAFAGYVPKGFQRVFPDANLTSMEWNKFNLTYRSYLLDPFDPHFQSVGNFYMEEMTNEFGSDHVYSCDTFNEVLPPTGDVDYLRKVGQAIYSSMTTFDAKAIWLMQNWLFVHDFIYWTQDRIEALITSVPLGKMIVLDLQSEQFPQYERLNNYYGQPYIWCMLHNFGGTLGMFGSTDIINQRPFEARELHNSTMIGTGLTPEGINQNYIIYELMTEMAWQEKPVNLSRWFHQYSERRYGNQNTMVDRAWSILMSTVYNFQGNQLIRGKYTMNRSPRIRIGVSYWYNACDVYKSWNYFLQASDALKNNLGYQHDLVDLTRQVLQLLGDQFYREMLFVYRVKDIYAFNNSANAFLSLFDDMDDVLSTNGEFLLGKWLNSAKKAANNNKDRKLFEYNARNQITLWGPNGEIKDYANKQWAGMVSGLFKPRWKLFLTRMLDALVNGQGFDESSAKIKVFKEVEEPFTFDNTEYPDKPKGDTVTVAKEIHQRWWSKIRCNADKATTLLDPTRIPN